MMDLLKYLDQRLGEPSTYAGIAGLLMAAHVSIPPGVWSDITLWLPVISAVIAVVLRESATKSPTQIAADVLATLQATKPGEPGAKS